MKTLDKIDAQIEVLKARKQKMVAIENNKNRKLLVKQKILVGAYIMNQLEKKIFLDKVKNSIDAKRTSDCFAINELIKNA